MARFDSFAVDSDVAAADRALNRRPACLAEARGEEEVEALILGLDGNCVRERERWSGSGRERERERERFKLTARNFIVLPLNGKW
jgi:hypothetical protein